MSTLLSFPPFSPTINPYLTMAKAKKTTPAKKATAAKKAPKAAKASASASVEAGSPSGNQ